MTLLPEPICDYLLIDDDILILHNKNDPIEPWYRPCGNESYNWEEIVELARSFNAPIHVLTIAEQIL